MMKRHIEKPVLTQDDSAIGGSVETHPAYAQIQANRVSGHAVLYGSEFRHQYYMTVRIFGSRMRRSLSNDWPHAAMRPYIEVSMSEAQWAHFVSSPNAGSGALCTLNYMEGKGEIPGLPDLEPSKERFRVEADETLREAIAALDALAGLIADSGATKGKQKDLLWKVEQARRGIGSSLKFVADQFGEHMERTAEKAKSEIDGYLMATLQSAGLQAISTMRETVSIVNSSEK